MPNTPLIVTRTVSVTVTSTAAYSSPIYGNLYQNPFNIGFGVKTSGIAVVYSIQHTFDDVWAMTAPNTSATWFPHEFVVSISASNVDGNYAFPVAAYRLAVSANPSAVDVVLTGIQSRD